MNIWLPTVQEMLCLHHKVTLRTGGGDGLRETGLLESAVARPHASFGGEDLYPRVIDKAAALCCGLTQNHPFVDGNKRIGVTAMLLVLRRNGVALRYTQQERIDLSLTLAQGLLDVPAVVDWIETHTPGAA